MRLCVMFIRMTVNIMTVRKKRNYIRHQAEEDMKEKMRATEPKAGTEDAFVVGQQPNCPVNVDPATFIVLHFIRSLVRGRLWSPKCAWKKQPAPPPPSE